MKKNTTSIIIGVLIILQVMSLSRIGDLRNDLRDTKNQLTSLAADHSNQISKIYTNIDSMLKRQSSIIDSYEYSLGIPDKENLTIPVTFSISPKETAADTVATLYVSNKSAVMVRNGAVFTATLQAGIFDTIEARVVLADSVIEKTEKLEISESLRHTVLPVVHAFFQGESGSQYVKKSGEYHRKGNLSLEVKPAQKNDIEKARLVIDIDGKEVSEKPVNTGTGGTWTEIDEKVTLSAGQTLTMWVMATDSLGLIHKTVIDKLVLDENSDPVHGDEWRWIGESIITDKDGKVLYTP